MLKSRQTAVFAVMLLAVTASAQDRPGDFAQVAARAAAARDANDAGGAIALYKQALELNPSWREGLWMAGSLQYESGAYGEGAESLSRLVKLTPQAGPAWALLGLCEYETGNYPLAFEQIRRSLVLGIGNQPQMTLVLKFHDAALLTKMGRFDEAIREYSGFIPSQVTDEQVLLGLGLAHLRVAETPAEIPPGRKDLLRAVGRAMAALLTADTAGAKTAYEDLIGRFPRDADAHYAYGYFLFGSDPDRAIQEWQRALNIDGSHAGAHAMTAWAYWLREENSSAALRHAEKAIGKDPGLTIAHIVLGRLYVADGRTGPGIEHLERAVREDPANMEAHLALATAYSQTGRKPEAQNERRLGMLLRPEAGARAEP